MRVIERFGVIGLWVLQIVVAALFVLIGTGKFGDPSWALKFARWGYPAGFYMVIGVVEAIGGLSLLVPRVATYGATLLGVIMVGASATHFVHGETARIGPPLVYLALLAVVAVARRRSAIRLLTGRQSGAAVGSV